MQPTEKKRFIPILIAAAIVIIVLAVVFAVIVPMNARAKKSEAALGALQNAASVSEIPAETPAPTPLPPWRVQIMRRYDAQDEQILLEERDPEGQLLAEENEDIPRREYTYDEEGRLIKTYDTRSDGSPISHVEYRYDAEGHELDEMEYTYKLASPGEFRPELFAHNRSVYDEHGNRTLYEKSRNGAIEKWIESVYTYDTEGRIVKQVDTTNESENGTLTETTQYSYDDDGRLIEENYAFDSRLETSSGSGTARTTYRFDVDGKLIEETHYADGKLSHWYEYNYRGGVLTKRIYHFEDGSAGWITEYDGQGNPIEEGMHAEERDASGKLLRTIQPDAQGNMERAEYTYDEEGRLLKVVVCWINPDKLADENDFDNPDWKLDYYDAFSYAY